MGGRALAARIYFKATSTAGTRLLTGAGRGKKKRLTADVLSLSDSEFLTHLDTEPMRSLVSIFRPPAAVFAGILWLGLTPSAFAQQGGTATGGQAGAAGAGAAGTGVEDAVQIDTSSISNVERGDTLGSAATTVGATDRGGQAGGATGGLGGFGGGGFGGLGALGNLFGGFNTGGNQSSAPVIRTRLRSAVTTAPVPPATVARTAGLRLQTIPGRPQFRGLNVQMQGRTAVLSGTVASQKDRRMSEMLLRLEPGVSRVVNEVIVAGE